jgi:SagB-type dehydrogenase family enzyme
MKRNNYLSFAIFASGLIFAFNLFCQETREETSLQNSAPEIIQLPTPHFDSETSVEKALQQRRSVRSYKEDPLSVSDISQILWAAQGITEKTYGLRTAPSAGALYPLELYLVVTNVDRLMPGVYKYIPQDHTIKKIIDGDKRIDVSNAALKQDAIENSSAIVIIAAIYERTEVKYGNRSERYVHIEVGHVGQNIYLQSVSLGIGTVMIGAFKDEDLKRVLGFAKDEYPLAIMPFGKI